MLAWPNLNATHRQLFDIKRRIAAVNLLWHYAEGADGVISGLICVSWLAKGRLYAGVAVGPTVHQSFSAPVRGRSRTHGRVLARLGQVATDDVAGAPVAGAMMAELIERCEAGLDHDGAPLQFHLEHIGRSIDVGFYSRLRKINPDSSFSVIG